MNSYISIFICTYETCSLGYVALNLTTCHILNRILCITGPDDLVITEKDYIVLQQKSIQVITTLCPFSRKPVTCSVGKI